MVPSRAELMAPTLFVDFCVPFLQIEHPMRRTVFTGLMPRIASTKLLRGFDDGAQNLLEVVRMARTPSREEVELRAYEIYEERGREEGHALEHWVAAEEELTNRLSAAETGSRIRAAVAQAMQKPATAGTNR